MSIEEGNFLIAEFMGQCGLEGKSIPNLGIVRNAAKYHSSWDWLMPVVEKVEWMDSDKIDSRITIERQHCTVYFHFYDGEKYEWMFGGAPKKENVWKSIVRFIQWYTQN